MRRRLRSTSSESSSAVATRNVSVDALPPRLLAASELSDAPFDKRKSTSSRICCCNGSVACRSRWLGMASAGVASMDRPADTLTCCRLVTLASVRAAFLASRRAFRLLCSAASGVSHERAVSAVSGRWTAGTFETSGATRDNFRVRAAMDGEQAIAARALTRDVGCGQGVEWSTASLHSF